MTFSDVPKTTHNLNPGHDLNSGPSHCSCSSQWLPHPIVQIPTSIGPSSLITMGNAGRPQGRDSHITACPLHPLGVHAPVYFYEFQHRPSFFKDTKPPHVRADHGDEMFFVFGTAFWKGYGKCSWVGSLRDPSFSECRTGPWLGP